MQITLTADIENALKIEARRRGVSAEQLALTRLRMAFISNILNYKQPTVAAPKTLLDSLGDYVGAVHSSEHIPGGANMSEDTGNKFAAMMMQKRELGQL